MTDMLFSKLLLAFNFRGCAYVHMLGMRVWASIRNIMFFRQDCFNIFCLNWIPCDEDIFVDFANCEGLSWKEILSLVDKYHKVNSFLVEHDTLIRKNFILPKSWTFCIIRIELMARRAHGQEAMRKEWWQARGRCGRKWRHHHMKRTKVVKKIFPVRFGLTARRSEIDIRAESESVLQIRRINTIWKAWLVCFPNCMPAAPDSRWPSRNCQNNTTVVFYQFADRVV